MPNTVLGDASRLIPDPTTVLSGGKPDANLLDLGSVVMSLNSRGRHH